MNGCLNKQREERGLYVVKFRLGADSSNNSDNSNADCHRKIACKRGKYGRSVFHDARLRNSILKIKQTLPQNLVVIYV